MSEIEAGKGKAAGIVGIFIIIFGLIDVILGIMWATYGGPDGQGLWSGFLLLLNGALGIVCWVNRNKVAAVFYLILALLNIILTIVQAALAALAWLIWQIIKGVILTKCSDASGRCVCRGESIPIGLDDCDVINTIDAIFLCLLILNGLAAIFVFAASIIGCMATCCASQPAQQTNVVIVQQPAAVGIGQAPPPEQQSYPMQ
ncbi:predicted protein [Nematostella vectensis]|uniref:Uncharacterized protein n=1 Tax=Nematostella vectensis TaxID=45351 RepID=A7SFP9_NEMVE|nr:uncharacterized protein LOC5508960 [Nematostella vectensis]EDO37434.1 predicted protein [Nematostella vectensis]|eukprot:XP_001629497.1 predicted protein [Nematostella vectensis]